MRIHIATDHAGLEFSTRLQHHLSDQGHDVVDHGPLEYDALDDYPAFCIRAAQAVVRDQAAGIETLGVVFGGSGNGEQIAANKVQGVRAALVWNNPTAELAREHNDANVIAVGARQHSFEEAAAFIDTFITTPFTHEERHVRRIRQIAAYETDGSLLPEPRATPRGPQERGAQERGAQERGAQERGAQERGGEDVDAFDPEAG